MKMWHIRRTDAEIDEQVELLEQIAPGSTDYEDKSYEDGARAMLDWMTGGTEAPPLDPELKV